MRPENLRRWIIHIEVIYLMFLSREIDIKLCQIFTKIHIYAILYKSWRIKQIIFNKYATNQKTTISHRSLRISGLLLLYFLFIFCILIDKIDNIITFSTYSPYYVTRTSANGSAVYWSRDFRLYHGTMILHYHWLKFWWRNTDYTPFHISFSVPLTLILTEE